MNSVRSVIQPTCTPARVANSSSTSVSLTSGVTTKPLFTRSIVRAPGCGASAGGGSSWPAATTDAIANKRMPATSQASTSHAFLIASPLSLAFGQAHVERRRLAVQDPHRRGVGRATRLLDLDTVAALCELNLERGTLERVPTLPIDPHRGRSRAHADRERPVVGASRLGRRRRRRWSARGSRAPWLGLSGRERLHHVPDLVGLSGREEHSLADRPMSREEELELVRPGSYAQPLRETVEVVGDAGWLTIDVDLRLRRADQQPGGALSIVREGIGDHHAGQEPCRADDTEQNRNARSSIQSHR